VHHATLTAYHVSNGVLRLQQTVGGSPTDVAAIREDTRIAMRNQEERHRFTAYPFNGEDTPRYIQEATETFYENRYAVLYVPPRSSASDAGDPTVGVPGFPFHPESNRVAIKLSQAVTYAVLRESLLVYIQEERARVGRPLAAVEIRPRLYNGQDLSAEWFQRAVLRFVRHHGPQIPWLSDMFRHFDPTALIDRIGTVVVVVGPGPSAAPRIRVRRIERKNWSRPSTRCCGRRRPVRSGDRRPGHRRRGWTGR
jgi:hypothetical protein